MNKIEKKLEDTLMYGYEEILYRYFKVFQNPMNYTLMKIKNFDQYYFMSERLYKIYQILLQKYPELKLQKDVYHQGESIPKKSTLYINDMIAELPLKIRFSDGILFMALQYFQTVQEYFRINCGKKIIESPWVNNDEESDAIEKDSTLSNSMKRKSANILYKESMRQSLNSLGLELQYLKNNGVLNAYDLAPISAKKYFKIIFENSEQIRYFLYSFYTLKYERDVTLDKDLLLIQKEALERTKKYFKENLNIEILTFFATITPSYYDFLHYPLDYTIDEISHKLDLLSGEIYDELARKDFSYKKLNKGYKYKSDYYHAIL